MDIKQAPKLTSSGIVELIKKTNRLDLLQQEGFDRVLQVLEEKCETPESVLTALYAYGHKKNIEEVLDGFVFDAERGVASLSLHNRHSDEVFEKAEKFSNVLFRLKQAKEKLGEGFRGLWYASSLNNLFSELKKLEDAWEYLPISQKEIFETMVKVPFNKTKLECEEWKGITITETRQEEVLEMLDNCIQVFSDNEEIVSEAKEMKNTFQKMLKEMPNL